MKAAIRINRTVTAQNQITQKPNTRQMHANTAGTTTNGIPSRTMFGVPPSGGKSSSRVLKKAKSPQRRRVTENRRDREQLEMPTNSYIIFSHLSLCLRVSVAKVSFSSAC